jgi:ankyrin repeat protein
MPMAEFRRMPAAALAIGLVLATLAGLGGFIAALCTWLAQPALALAVSWWQGSRAEAGFDKAGRATIARDAATLLGLWAAGLGLTALLIAWPLAGLRQSGSLGAAIGLSLVAGVVWLGLWRTWPIWRALECNGGGLRRRWQQLDEVQIGISSGWRAATLVAAMLAVAVVLALPGLLAPAVRWSLAVLYAITLPVLHGLLQRTPPPLAMAEDPAADDGDDAAAHDTEDDPTAALYAAARSGRVERALALLEAGADPHAPPAPEDRDQRTLPLLAAVLPDLRLLRALIADGVQVNQAHAGMTPLLAATRDSWHGRPEAVMTLLANGADPRVADADGNTPLHHAARSTDPGVAALLRDAAAEIDALNHEGQSPLAIACAAGNWRLARFLLERGARTEPAQGQPALLSAAAADEDDPAGVQLLLKYKARVDARDACGRTALHAACSAGHADIVATLLAAGADAQARDDAGRTPLLEAAQAGSLAVVERLAEVHADPTAADAEGRSALLCASMSERATPALLRRLLELGADRDHLDREGKRAIDRAAERGRWAIVTVLDPDYPLPSNVDGDGGDDGAPADRTPLALLRAALRDGRDDGNDALAKLLGPAELGGLLHDAELDTQAIDWLLARGADPDTRDAQGDNVLFAALTRGHVALPLLQVLLRRAASPAGAGGLARFVAACSADDRAGLALEQFAVELLERGADPFGRAPSGDPALALAVRLGWLRLADRLIAHGVDPDARDAHGMTSLHLAAALGRESVLKQLIARGASPDLRAADGQTPLGVALSGGRRDLANWLDWRGWSLPRRALQPGDLPAAAIVGDADAVRRLLDLGLPVDAVDSQGCTALLRAAGGGHRATVDLLLARGSDPGRAAHSGATPLSAAVSMRQTDIVDSLLAAGAQLEQRLPGDVTVLMLAAALGLPDLAARLLTAGANVHASDAQGLMPLHCAALYGFTARERPRLLALIDTLLLAGAEPDTAAAGGVTPLLLMLGARAEPGTACDEDTVLAALDRLLEEEVSLDAQDPRGFGPLHLAALHGLLRVTQRLLRAGSEPDLRDALNRTPREIAVMRGFVDVAGEFAPLQSGVSTARFLREPR